MRFGFEIAMYIAAR